MQHNDHAGAEIYAKENGAPAGVYEGRASFGGYLGSEMSEIYEIMGRERLPIVMLPINMAFKSNRENLQGRDWVARP